MRASTLVVLALMSPATAVAADVTLTGHVKARAAGQTFPDNSVFRDLSGPRAGEIGLDGRLNLGLQRGAWFVDAAYQVVGIRGDAFELGDAPGIDAVLPQRRRAGDGSRYLDLTDTWSNNDRRFAAQRLDRLTLGYTGERLVLKIGRQALSFGNGLYFAPLDIVNPFDPAAIDTEYKAGDDMVYAQYLLENGDDVEAAFVLRRDADSGAAGADQRTTALRYTGLRDWGDFTVLAANSYGDALLGLGVGGALGGAVWNTELAASEAGGTTAQFLANLAWSWNWGERNVSGAVEYYFNGFGLPGGDYDLAELAAADDLAERLARGELFGIGRHYVAAGMTVEVSPLATVSPLLVVNAGDGSAFLQLSSRLSVADNLEFIAAFDLPIGPDGSEYGGLAAPEPERYFSRVTGIFAQLAWYF